MSAHRVARLAIALLALSALLAGGAVAQTVSASLSGRVLTPEGDAVEGATVTARSVETGSTRVTVTGRDGGWLIPSLAPGRYELIARGPDGNRVGPLPVRLALQQSLVVDLELLTGITEEVTVRGTAPLIDESRSWSELRIGGEQTDALPVDGRTVTDLALLDSSIVQAPEGAFYGERGNVFVVGGQSGRANAFLVDGLDNGDRVSSTTLGSFFSQQVIDEFVVMTRQFDPEFGRASGGVLNILTRRGTNTQSGELIVQGTTPSWNSEGDFVSGLPRGQEERTTGRSAVSLGLGGPLVRDRAFYFVSYERQAADEALAYTGVDRDGLPGGVVVAPSDGDSLFLRTDFNLGERNSLMLRVSHDDRATDGLNITGLLTPEAGFTLDERDSQFAASLKTIVSPSVINEVRVLAGRSEFDQRARSSRPGVDHPSGIFGGNDLNRQLRDERRLQLIENVTWIKGDHVVKFGLDVLKTRTTVRTRFNPNGAFLYRTDTPFEPGDCGDLRASEIAEARRIEDEQGILVPIDCPGQVGVDDDGDGSIDEPGLWWTYPLVFRLIEGAPLARLDDTQVALFAQDSWAVNDKLTLSYGLRYDLSSFELPDTARVSSDVIPNGAAPRDTDNVAPRVAFAWRPKGDETLVVRGGAGMFYDKIPLAFPALSDVTAGTRIGLLFPQGLGFEITEDVVEQFGIDAIRPGLVFPDEVSLRFSTGTELDTPYVVQASAGMDWSYRPGQAFSVDLERTIGQHQVLLRDINPVVATGNFGIPEHRDPDLGSIAAIVTEGRSWYWGVTTAWRWRSEENWASASMTVSRAEDYASDPLKGGLSLPPDSDDLAGERARSDGDRRLRFVLAGGVPLPGGFRGSLVAQFASAAPFNVVTGIDENLDGFVNERLPGARRNEGEETDLVAVNALRAREGLPGIASLEEPDYFQVDARLTKPFGLGGRFGGELFVQVFNVFDRVNAGAIEGRIVSRNFGRPLTLAGPPRTLEAGLKVAF